MLLCVCVNGTDGMGVEGLIHLAKGKAGTWRVCECCGHSCQPHEAPYLCCSIWSTVSLYFGSTIWHRGGGACVYVCA